MNDAKINEFLNGRGFAIICCLLLVVTAFIAVTMGEVPHFETGNGIFFDIKGAFIENPVLSMAVNVTAIIGISLLALLLNKLYSFIKAFTFIGAASFFLLELALPLTSSLFDTDTLLCFVLMLGTLILFGTYESKSAQRPIFLVLCILGFLVLFCWAAVVLILAFILGFAYMRTMNWKSCVAAIIGLLTPFWIVLGLGLVSPFDFKLIEVNGIWGSLEGGQVHALIVWEVIVVILAIVLSVINLLQIYHYRLQLRVYNAFFLLVTVLCIIGMCVDYRDMVLFIPMLNLCLSVQIAHTFTISKFAKRYIFIFVLMAASLAAFTCNLLL
ncbi:MAG: hypothetical protein J5565_03455 [Muribaculaceae bacterium]|nr:hypothetical protein [Muribaculaceae bacterium]